MVMAIFATGFFLVWRADSENRAPLYSMLAYACGSIGFLLDFAIRDDAGPVLGHYVSNVWLIAFPLLQSAGTRLQFRSRPWFGPLAAIYATTFAVASFFIFVAPNETYRAITMNWGAGALIAMALPALYRRKAGIARQVLFWLFALSAVQFFARPLLVFAYSPGATPGTEGYSQSLYALTLHFTSAICSISAASLLLFYMAVSIVRRLDREGVTDPLTGMLNRRGLDKAFTPPCNNSTTSIVLADIDHFKSVNDTFGHDVGDEAIRLFAECLSESAPYGASVARIGGEEFVILLPDRDTQTAIKVAEGARARFKNKRLPSMGERAMSASFGVSGCRAGADLADALKAADQALYQAKEYGRDRVVRAGNDSPPSQTASVPDVPHLYVAA